MKTQDIKLEFLPPKRISCGHKFTMAVNDSGELFAWGCNANYKLGLNMPPNPVWNPRRVKQINGNVNQVDCGSEFTMCIVQRPGENKGEEGELLAWGVNSVGQLGTSEGTDVLLPEKVPFPELVCRVSCGSDFTACIGVSGRVYTWGRGTHGNLGHGDTLNQFKPKLVEALGDYLVSEIACGAKHCMARTQEFRVFSWGNGANGRLGHGDSSGCVVPKLVEALKNQRVLNIACGEGHSGCVTSEGEVYTWGAGSFGRLGHGIEKDTYTPAVIITLQGKRIYMLACGFRHNLALSIQGEVYSWGAGNYGVTGLFDIKEMQTMLTPLQVSFFQGKRVTQVAVGNFHSIAITSVGEVYSWGYHGHGRLGLGSSVREDQAFPCKINSGIYGVTGGVRVVEKIAKITGSKPKVNPQVKKDPWKVVRVECGAQHSVALTGGGSVWVWGGNRTGALGIGQEIEEVVNPVVSHALKNSIVTNIACGSQHTLVTTSKGEVYTWGRGRHGQLGVGFIHQSYSPKLVEMLHDKFCVMGACGEDFSLVLTDSGEVHSFGNADKGCLGQGSTQNQLFPKQVTELMSIKKISAGMNHSAALSQEGIVFVWGGGYYGRLGYGSTDNVYYPVQIHSKYLRLYQEVSCGAFHTLFIDDSGSLLGTGRKEMICSREDQNEPKEIIQLSKKKFSLVSAGEEHSLAVSEDGDTYIWGFNKYGKLGNNTESEENLTPKKLNLPRNLAQVSTRMNHNLAVTKTGEVYSWGCGSGGRLGFGSTKNVLVPSLLKNHWSSYEDSNQFLTVADELNMKDLVISQVENGVVISRLKDLIVVLQSEDPECFHQELINKQKQIAKQLQTLLINIQNCKQEEINCLTLMNQIESKILQRTFELKLPAKDYIDVHIPKQIASNFRELESLIVCLREQPCFFSELIKCTIKKKDSYELTTLVRCIQIMFSNINFYQNTKKDSLVFLSLCKEVIAGEVNSAKNIQDVFESSLSPSALFLKTFFTKEFGGNLFRKILEKPINEAVEMIKFTGEEYFSVDPRAVLSNTSQKSIESLMSDPKIRERFAQNLLYMVKAASLFIESFKALPGMLPYHIKLLMKHAYSKMMEKVWSTSEKSDSKLNKAIMKLLFNQLLVPIIQTPEAEGINTQHSKTPLLNITDILKKVFENSSYSGNHYEELNIFISNSHEQLQNTISACIEIEDTLEVDLLISTFSSHFILDSVFIQFPVNDLLKLLAIIVKYKSHVKAFQESQQVSQLIEKVGPVGVNAGSTLENYKLNFKVSSKFLFDKEAKVCGVCGIPMEANLAVKTNTEQLFKTYQTTEEDNSLVPIENACRSIPKFSANNLTEFSENLRKVVEKLLSVRTT